MERDFDQSVRKDDSTLLLDAWLDRLRMTESRLDSGSVLAEQGLRHTFHLLQLCPPDLKAVFQPLPAEDEFESLLDEGDFDTAAEHLAATDMLERHTEVPDGHAVSQISCPIMDLSSDAVAKERSVAILLALVRTAIQVGENVSRPVNLPDRAGHRHPHEQRRPSTEH